MPAGAGGADRLHGRLLGSDGLDDRVRAEPVGEFLDPFDAGVAAFGDDVGRAVEAGQFLPLGVAGHRDDPVRAQVSGGEDGHQADRAVADDDGLAGAGVGGVGAVPAGAEYVGGGQQGGDQVRGRLPRGGHERAVGVRDAGLLGLGADRLPHQLPLYAAGLVARAADLDSAPRKARSTIGSGG